MKIENEKVVSINYTLRNDQGEILDTSDGHEPLAYIHGMGNIVPGLESQLNGKSVGDSLKISVAPVDGYGEYDLAQVVQVSRSQFEGVPELKVGMQFTASSPEGNQVVTITNINNDTVTVDGNHPLAGKTLHFDITVVDVRNASADELSHGHVHGAGGHHH
ncbi:MAG: peptidylprolyl isomerase [Ignavibacteriales bacterium]|nr:peptidylprolyl isomerase [Ignavibacteriales bacterium]